MRFEKFLLENYIASAEGKNIYDFFKNIHKTIAKGDKDNEVTNFINSLLHIKDAKVFYPFEPYTYEENGELVYPPFEEFEKEINKEFQIILKEWKCSERDILGDIPYISLVDFYRKFPAYAFPYLFPVHFYILEDICKEFNIILPKIPSGRKHRERLLYYIELCRTFYNFRQQYNLSPEEFSTFLYGFAPKFVNKNILSNELPQANKVWIVGASQEDSENNLPYLDEKSIFWWSGKENMAIGDIVFIYEINPYSRIKYMARACTNGYDDPFQYYSGKIMLTDLKIIPEITYKNLAGNKHFSKNGLVKSHMQGLSSGRELSNADYEEIKNLLSEKKYDITNMPETISFILNIDIDINYEKDVEKYLLEPLLAKLGYKEKDYIRQMPLRMGRGISYYPDYVIHPNTSKDSEAGEFIWEAKHHIITKKDFDEALYQAKSYALRLSTKGLALASYEGIWVSLAKDKYSKEKIIHYTWQSLEDNDIFNKLKDSVK